MVPDDGPVQVGNGGNVLHADVMGVQQAEGLHRKASTNRFMKPKNCHIYIYIFGQHGQNFNLICLKSFLKAVAFRRDPTVYSLTFPFLLAFPLC